MSTTFRSGLARHQQGASFAEWLFIAFALLVLLLLGVKLYAPIVNNYKLDQAIKTTLATADLNKAKPATILADIQTNLRSNNVPLQAENVLAVSANPSGVFVAKKYSHQFALYGPVDMVIKFDKNYDTARTTP